MKKTSASADYAVLASRKQMEGGSSVPMRTLVIAFMLFAAAGLGYGANTLYVWTNCLTSGSPYNAWTNAALSIQIAVDASGNGDTIYVTNGTYETGATLTAGHTSSNRVYITKFITLCSFNNDRTNTIIKGNPDSITGKCGDNAVRCVCINSGAGGTVTLIGFTLTNGYTQSTIGGLWHFDQSGGGIMLMDSSRMIVSNCVITDNKAYSTGAGVIFHSYTSASYARLYDCVISKNITECINSGAYGALFNTYCADIIMTNCTIAGNNGYYGGGVSGGATVKAILYNCTLSNNYSPFNGANYGAAAADCILFNCMLSSNTVACNSTRGGGGAGRCILSNCTLIGNSVTFQGNGGAVFDSTLYNCLLISNSAVSFHGGGAFTSTMYNCTLSANSAAGDGGGVYSGTLYNCISWGNNKADYGVTAYYSCGIDYSGNNNTSSDPLFAGTNAGNYRLTLNSPCMNRGTNGSWTTGAVDRDGRRRIDVFGGRVDMGCYEYLPNGTLFRIP